jgi:hypothetical protein
MKLYKRIFREWLPSEFNKAREKGLLDSPKQTQKKNDFPDYLIEYIQDTTITRHNYLADHELKEAIKEFRKRLSSIKKNKIDPSKYTCRIIIYKNNFYSSGDKGGGLIHLDILAYLVLYEGLVFEDYDDFLEFQEKKNIKDFLCLGISDNSYLTLGESYDISVKKLLVNIINKNVNNYYKVISKIFDLVPDMKMSSMYGVIEGLPANERLGGWGL